MLFTVIFCFTLFLSLQSTSSIFFVQTDMMDLLGSDLPVESDEGMKFSWSDGILLQVDLSYYVTYHVNLSF